jgi:hypothetical protein
MPYYPFIDWLKCIGMTLIVVGHVAGAPINNFVLPIYPKQLGVAFFVFAIGFSLANEARPIREVFFKRLFEIYLFGIASALLMSAVVYVQKGDINESNYLPFLGGINILLNYFPANPTTWYIGTYLHLLVFWALFLRGRRVTPRIIIGSLTAEIIIRAILIVYAGRFIAYMPLPNWITVLLAGSYFASLKPPSRPSRLSALLIALLLGIPLVWSRLASMIFLDQTFPFARLDVNPPLLEALLTSLLVSAWYLGFTICLFVVTRQQSAPNWVRFIARNTIPIFILHMPLFYLIASLGISRQSTYAFRSLIYLTACLPLLAALSEILHKVIPLSKLRSRLGQLKGITPSVPASF